MNVAFLSGQLNERGTSVALYDYAHFNETLLHNKSYIMTREGQPPDVMERYVSRFDVLTYKDAGDVNRLIAEKGIDVCYMLEHGRRLDSNYVLPEGCRTAVHCVFKTSDPHGDVYACISEEVNRRSNTNFPVVPHMVHLPSVDVDMRLELGIPETATVFGRHGGYDTFNLQFVHEIVQRVVQERADIYFLFMNTRPFTDSGNRQIIHLPACYDIEKKVAFINTCDAMLHGRKDGETFGLSIGEFSIRNRPVITWKLPEGPAYLGYRIQNAIKSMIPGMQRLPRRLPRAHLDILAEKAITYRNRRELYRILTTFDAGEARGQDWDAYSRKYSPEAVMPVFEKVFLRQALLDKPDR